MPGSHRKARRYPIDLGIDAAIVTGITIFAAFLSGARTWTGFNTPDSEFYASLSLFGNDVTDRSIDPAYTWTRLGYIAPVRLLVTHLDPWIGFAAWRFLLLLVIVASLFAMVRLASTRQLATLVAGFAALNTVVLSYVGNTYVTGTILAATVLLLTLGAWGSLGTPRRPWVSALLSGLVAGWLVMLNPYALLLGMSMWGALRFVRFASDDEERWRALWRDVGVGIVGFGVASVGFLAAGLTIFPHRNWVSTYLTWNSHLDFESFIGERDVWQRDVALLVPVAAILISVIALLASRGSRWALGGLVVAVASVAFTLGYFLVVPGPWLEAPHYVALLWPGALSAVALSFAAIVGGRDLGRPGWIAGAAAVPVILWTGRWDAAIAYAQGLIVVGVTLLLIVVAVVLRDRVPAAVTSVLVVASLATVAIGAQVLQNGRGLLGIYGQFPFRAAYVDFDADRLMRSKVAAEEFVLAHTGPQDTIGIWTDPDRMTAAIAAMQLWGQYNNVSSGGQLSEVETQQLALVRPSAIAMYAPTKDAVYAFWSSLPVAAKPSVPDCTSVPYLGIGSPDAQVCVTHLAWPR